VVQHYGYSPYGCERYRANDDAFSVSNRYTGQTLDEDTGLYYYGARYYDPELARFLQPDSTVPDPEFSQAYNRYAYVYNNPLKFSDPTGQNPLLIAFIIKGALIGGSIGAGVSAIMGGDPLKGFIAGAIGGAFGGLGSFMGLGPVGMGLMGAAGGALGAVATGGDPLMGAISGGITSGIMAAMQFSPITSFDRLFTEEALKRLVVSTSIGATVGGTTAEMFGGGFGQGATYGAMGSAASFAVAASMGQFVEPVADYVAEHAAHTIDIAVAFVQDRIHGPLDTIIIWGEGIDETQWREITVKAYRLNEAIGKYGTSWAISKNEIHTMKSVIDELRASSCPASRVSPAFDDLQDAHGRYIPGTGFGSAAEMHIAHEIGHTAQAVKMGPAYLPLVAGTTSFGGVPVLNHFERNASFRGLYGGIRR
jgi:RHS repeat-associated protein